MTTQPDHPRPGLVIAIWAAFLLAFMNAVLFTLHTASTFLRNDEWRQFKYIVIPILNDNASLLTLWKNHHPYPFLHIIQILNICLFHYQPEYQAIFGLIFQGLTGGLLLWMFLLTTRETLSPLARFCFCTFLSAAAFGLNSGVVYSWPAIGVLQFFFFILVLFCFVLDSALRSESRALLATSYALAALLLLINGDFGTIFVVAMPPALVLTRGFGWKKSLRDALVFLLMILAYRAFLHLSVRSPGQGTGNVSELLERTGPNVLDMLLGYATGITSGLVNLNDFRNKFPWAEVPLLAFSALIALLQISILALYLKNKNRRQHLLPVVLTLAGLLFCASLAIFRLGDEDMIWVFPAPRYGSVYRLICMGSLFALPTGWHDAQRWTALHRKLAGALILSVLAVLLVLQVVQSLINWNRAHVFADINQRHPLSIAMAALRDEGALPLPSNIAGANKQLGPVLDFIQQRRLNVFSRGMAGSRLLADYMQSRSAYLGSGQALFALADLDAGHGQWTQGLISLALDQGGMTLTNGGERRVAVRLAVESQDYTVRGLKISTWEPEQKNSERALDLLAGTQAHYCSLEGKGTIIFKIPGNAHFRSVAVRQAAEP